MQNRRNNNLQALYYSIIFLYDINQVTENVMKMMFFFVLSLVIVIQSQTCPFCDYAIAGYTHPNPQLYYEKDANGTYRLIGKANYDSVKNIPSSVGFYNDYLAAEDLNAQVINNPAYNCVVVNLSNYNILDPDISLGQFQSVFNSSGHFCTIPQNTVILSWRTGTITKRSDNYRIGAYNTFIRSIPNTPPSQYRKVLLAQIKLMKLKIDEYHVTSAMNRANYDQDSAFLGELFAEMIRYNIQEGHLIQSELPNRIQSLQRSHVVLLPPGNKFMIGKFIDGFNPNVDVMKNSYRATRECKYT